MSFEQLQEAIFTEANEQIRDIKSRYQKQLLAEEKRIQHNAQEIEESIIEQAEQEGSQEANRLHQVAQLQAKAAILKAKQEELEATYQATVEGLLGLSGSERASLIKQLFDLLLDSQGSLTPGSRHAAEVGREARRRGYQVAQDAVADDGGFVFHGQRSDVNLTVRALVKRIFDEHRVELASALFE